MACGRTGRWSAVAVCSVWAVGVTAGVTAGCVSVGQLGDGRSIGWCMAVGAWRLGGWWMAGRLVGAWRLGGWRMDGRLVGAWRLDNRTGGRRLGSGVSIGVWQLVVGDLVGASRCLWVGWLGWFCFR